MALRTTPKILRLPPQRYIPPKKAIAKAKRGDVVTIFAIKSTLAGNTTYK